MLSLFESEVLQEYINKPRSEMTPEEKRRIKYASIKKREQIRKAAAVYHVRAMMTKQEMAKLKQKMASAKKKMHQDLVQKIKKQFQQKKEEQVKLKQDYDTVLKKHQQQLKQLQAKTAAGKDASNY